MNSSEINAKSLMNENEEFESLIKKSNQIIYQTEFDLNNGEYIYKQHCNELRRQVQLAKETQILKIEEITDNLMKEIDEFEKESLDTVSKVNKEQLVNKLNEMKQENEKWNRLDKLRNGKSNLFKVDNQILYEFRNSLSKVAVERDNFKCLLHKKMMKFREHKDQSLVGELSQVSLDSFNQISFKKQIKEIEKRYNRLGLEVSFYFHVINGKILSNGDLLLCGKIEDIDDSFQDLVLAIFDTKKDKLKKIKQLFVDYVSMDKSSNKICLTFLIKDQSERYLARERIKDDEEYEKHEETNDQVGEFVILILNENLEILQRFKSHEMYLIGVNDSYLFFINDSEHLNGKVSFYNWSMEYVKTIGFILKFQRDIHPAFYAFTSWKIGLDDIILWTRKLA